MKKKTMFKNIDFFKKILLHEKKKVFNFSMYFCISAAVTNTTANTSNFYLDASYFDFR